MQRYKFLPHTADVKFQAFGKTIEEAFGYSALALINAMCKNKIKPVTIKKIVVKGRDMESLLYNFLEEFLFLLDSEKFILAEISSLKISKGERGYMLICKIIGDEAKNYEIENNIKAVTYNEMFVKKKKDKWACQVVIDV